MSAYGSAPDLPVTDLADDALLVDVREQDEWDAGHAPGAVHLPMSELSTRLGELPEAPDGGSLPVVCRSGQRSGRVVAWLSGQGIDSVNVAGGMQAWSAAGKPMAAETGSTPRVA